MSELETQVGQGEKNPETNKNEGLDPNQILMAEFGYARETAGQAMEDRHKMVNYYLIIVGVLLNAVASLITSEKKIGESVLGISELKIEYAISALLFTLFLIGVLYLYKLIRLRRAWYESALAMNKIKNYYDDNLQQYQLKSLAFEWTLESLKKMKLNKNCTLFFYSALLIMLIDALALSGGMIFLEFPFYIIAACFALAIVFQFGIYKSKLKV